MSFIKNIGPTSLSGMAATCPACPSCTIYASCSCGSNPQPTSTDTQFKAGAISASISGSANETGVVTPWSN